MSWTPLIYHFTVGGLIFLLGISLYYAKLEPELKAFSPHQPVIFCLIAIVFYFLLTFTWQWLAIAS